MDKALPALATVALLALTACESKKSPQEVTSEAPDPQAAEIASRAPIELPPAIKADVTFRCKDNSLVYVTFFQGDKQALLKTVKDGAATKLSAAAAGDPLKADGYSMTGNPKNITLEQTGKPSLTCKA